jgi:predicted DsbA family dithiol-disulfide isomerase
MRVVNTFRAHQLLHWAGEQGKQTALKLALFEAFFSRRKDVNDVDVLIRTAASVGLSASDASDVLADGRYAEQVRSDEQWWLDREIHAVPAFIFNDRYSVLGAQEAQTFARVLNKLATRARADLSSTPTVQTADAGGDAQSS